MRVCFCICPGRHFAGCKLNSYKTVRFYFIPERMWKECYEIICIVEDGADGRRAS